MVGGRGLEPPRIAPLAPKASVYTNFTIRPEVQASPDFWVNPEIKRAEIFR